MLVLAAALSCLRYIHAFGNSDPVTKHDLDSGTAGCYRDGMSLDPTVSPFSWATYSQSWASVYTSTH